MAGWRFSIDRGGTFTDIVALAPDGRIHTRKVLSRRSGTTTDSAITGIREILGLAPEAPIPKGVVHEVRMGTTVATNALLERKGEPTLLVITHGLKDQIEIGHQARPDIFALRVVKPDLLYESVVEAHERIRADGAIERPLDVARLKRDLEEARGRGIRSVAIVLMHAALHPEHERQAADAARQLGFENVSASHEISALIRIVPRGETTLADAYLTPVLKRYIDVVAGSLPQVPLSFMASSGGLMTAAKFRGRDAILSGPAGGVVAMAETARRAGFPRAIGFDMGGTSTDVAHFAGTLERTFETEISGVRLNVPMLKVHTVAAGGGSIIRYDGVRLRVGPESAGATPGPMCYRLGGPLTVTDANVALGKLQPGHFPCVFGKNGSEPIDVSAVRAAFGDLARETGGDKSAEEIADGAVRIAVESMSAAIKRISVARGYDVTGYALNAFGSAAGQHACLIADRLGMERILIHPLSGLLSAYGISLSRRRSSREQAIEALLDDALVSSLEQKAAELGATASRVLVEEGVPQPDIAVTAKVHVKYLGADSALTVPLTSEEEMRAEFTALHQREFGFAVPERALVVAILEVEAIDAASPSEQPPIVPGRGRTADAEAAERVSFYSGGLWHDAPVVSRDQLAAGTAVDGPALIIEPHQTVVVEPGWRASIDARANLVLSRSAPEARASEGTAADPIRLEVYANRFMAIAEEMGEALRATAQSVNIKERLDFSCAVFDANGDLVANAPHVPVHLGSMDRAVAAVIAAVGGAFQPGDSYMLNAPYNGGTHLPDITVVTPVFVGGARGPSFYVASRGHHADVGGLAPGSMSPRARSIEEEGVYIDVTALVRAGRFLEQETYDLLTRAPFPARNPALNIADLKAQLAANARGSTELVRLSQAAGLDVVTAYMSHVQDAAEAHIRGLIRRLHPGRFEVVTDQGARIALAIRIDRERGTAVLDFTGTSPERADSFNAPEPVTRAAVLYCLRVLLGEPIPINAGCLRPVEIVVPERSMLSPRHPAPVVAGNTETSQVVTNCIFAALGALGSSQGTMNNLTFGNDRVQYYETICSGAPAGPGFDGAAGVHVHMTNTRLTDPEVLEMRLPVVLEEFAIRRRSGGRGRWNSGDGTRRVLRFLEPVTVSILSGFRHTRPFGLKGGEPGAAGRNFLRRRDGSTETLGACAEARLEAGDAIGVETPTGGGYGETEDAVDKQPA